ncbi:hypothetical protein CVT24_002750 [Panaeolus cyanescens]|uniref:Uncharacterized protein n=1 Tax=Panaeolus cyanescens TaxID=181874 RepID=A0A409XAL5_9AGAR|nr:hypothetical protein CVT24_002750 [Panaeolus cyanescens]
MFPDKVERLIIDRVYDAYDYYDSSLLAALLVALKTYLLSQLCDPRTSSTQTMASMYSSLNATRQGQLVVTSGHKQLPISDTTSLPWSVVDIELLQGVTFTSLYKPSAAFPLLAEAFAALAQGDGSIILSMAGGIDPLKCPAESNTEPVGDAQAAILCNDGAEIPGDLESTQKYAQMMKHLCPTWGPIWSGIRMTCIDWPKFQKKQFGPFNATTSHPLLVIGNTAGESHSSFQDCPHLSYGFRSSYTPYKARRNTIRGHHGWDMGEGISCK